MEGEELERWGGARTFVAGLVIGVLVGAGVALLFAPQSGGETRRLIRRRAKKIAAGAQDRYDDLKDRVRRARRRRERDDEATG
ncbi:MAG: YtxH domain-containing protein [Gemmatimonadetes bacterium]|nr:YtxH domain-containing protein [Gemmatimonadota bacterium]